MLATPATPLGQRLTDTRSDEALVLQALQRRVNSANRELTSGPLLDLATNRRAVRVGAELKQRQQHQLFEITED